MLLLAGCGEDESVHTGAEAQTEENMPEETQDAEETAGTTDTAETAGTAAKEEKDQNSVEETAQQSGPWNKEAREQMEIDEETRRELTEELLEEENMDLSVMEDRRTTTGCSFDIPEGFAESEEVANLYVRKRYPIDASTIYYAVMEEDIALQLLSEEAFAEQLGITDRHLRNLITKDTNSSCSVVYRISKVLEIPMEVLVAPRTDENP